MTLRLAFMGSPAFSVPALELLLESGYEIAAVYSKPPKPRGRRGLQMMYSPVHARALEAGLTVYTPHSLRDPEQQKIFSELGIDVAIVVAYGIILPKAILEAPRLGCYNIHASLLPRWRGAAPIHRAIMAGDEESGVMIMKMDEGLDTGPILSRFSVAIEKEMTMEELDKKLSIEGARLLVKSLPKLESGDFVLTPQSSKGVTYAEKISKEEARIDWYQPAHILQKKICGLSPFPGAWCIMHINGKSERVKLLRARLVQEKEVLGLDFKFQAGAHIPGTLKICCGDNKKIEILQLQREGGKKLSKEEFLSGALIEAIF